MTKLPETISKRVNVITGEEVPLGCVDQYYPRASGRTTAIILSGLSQAVLFGSSFVMDHSDYDKWYTLESAERLSYECKQVASKLGLRGLTFSARRHGSLRHRGAEVWGLSIAFDVYEEVHYDLRK